MDDPLSIAGGAVIALGLAGIFVLSLAEAALLSASDVSLRRLAEKGKTRAALIQRLKSNNDYLSAIIVGINAAVILVSTMMTVLVHHKLGPKAGWQGEAWHVGTIAVILVFAELTPKTWGALDTERTALRVAPLVQALTVVSAPVVRLMTGISNVVLRIAGAPRMHRRHFITAEEIQAAADIGEEEGLVQPEEGEMLDNVIELGDTSAREIMVPRVDIVAVSESASLAEAVTAVSESGYSRIPVYRETLDDVTGILYANDLLSAFRSGQREADLLGLAREPVFVPEKKRVSELFRELRDQSVHIAVVVDEFGGTEGIVTIEDILEELVGDISDEHDAPSQDIQVVSDIEVVAEGRARIADVNQQLDIDLADDEYETIGGFVAGELGCIPQVGGTCRSGRVEITVEQGTDQHVERVRIMKTDIEGAQD